MWPFRRRYCPIAKPHIDLDTPVTNPRLVAAIDALSDSSGAPQRHKLVAELRRAVFLVGAITDDAELTSYAQQGQVSIEEGSHIGILELEDPQGKRVLPLFTDMGAVKKHIDKPTSTLVIPAVDAWEFVANKYDAAIINPAGPALPLDRDQINDLARTAVPSRRGIFSRIFGRRKVMVNALAPVDPAKGVMVLAHNVRTKYRRAQDVPDDLRSRLVEICSSCDFVAACYLLDVMEPATGDIKLFVSLSLDRGEHDLLRVGPRMQQAFRDFPEYDMRFFIGADTFGELNPALLAYARDAT
jgi:hypothetical protein